MTQRFPLNLAAVLALSFTGAFAGVPVKIKCGTAQAAQRFMAQRAAGRTASARLAASSLPSARTYTTTHFAFHYSLAADVNRVKLVTQDASLKRQVDSILQSPSASRLHTILDSIGAPQPLFVQRAAVYFERAYVYYVNTLGMLAPPGGVVTDQVFNIPSDGSRFTVDIADVGTVDPSFSGEPVYGLTYPHDTSLGNPQYILLDNDFLYSASWNPASQSTQGSPLQSYLNDQLLYDYTVKWDLGIKITASHEFYHAIQYTYRPDPIYHAWYELSAVGMEERLVPESEDYFQYLPSVLQHHETVSLLTPPQSTENYGNATFHQFLTLEFGTAFDVKMWATLKTNGDILPSALSTVTASFGARWDTLYASYAAALATAGRAGSASTCMDTIAPIFTRDIHCWPTPSYDTLPSLGGVKTLGVPAVTFRLLKPSAGAIIGSLSLTGLNGGVLVQKNGTGFTNVAQAGVSLNLFPSTDSSTLGLTVANPSFTQSGQIAISTRSSSFTAFPNPVNLSGAAASFFAPPGTVSPSILTVVSESGRRVAELPFNATQSSWSWDLKDEQSRLVSPGVYYYRIAGQPVKTLLILPN